jgi:S1-C subfamily serine protease
VPGGPAARAGIRTGDVILAIDGQPTTDVRALQRRMLAAKIGEPVTLRVWRDSRALDTIVRPAELEA